MVKTVRSALSWVFFFSPVTLVISLKFPNSNGGVVYLSIKGFITGI